MTGPKTEEDVAYTEGFDAGRNSSSLDDVVMSLAGGLVGPLFDGPHQDIYDKGYTEGQKSRD